MKVFIESYGWSIKFKENGEGVLAIGAYPHDYDKINYQAQYFKQIVSGFRTTGMFWIIDFTNIITGYGNYKWSNKHQYIGDFIEGEMNGKGNYKWPDGTEYNGEYLNNIKEGYGEFKWSNGAIFKGKFHNGKPNGKGIMTYKGYSFNAEFKNGHFVGDLKSILKSFDINQ